MCCSFCAPGLAAAPIAAPARSPAGLGGHAALIAAAVAGAVGAAALAALATHLIRRRQRAAKSKSLSARLASWPSDVSTPHAFGLGDDAVTLVTHGAEQRPRKLGEGAFGEVRRFPGLIASPAIRLCPTSRCACWGQSGMCRLSLSAAPESLRCLRLQVYLGKWRGSEVAVKVLRGGVSPEAAADFRLEVDMLASLRHPNILLFLGAALDTLPVRLVGIKV